MLTSWRARSAFSIRWYFLFFFVSGFCSLLYEVVWLRLAMAKFGVTSALLSIVLSVFMAGLGLGSWASGRLIRQYAQPLARHALRLYGLAELLIGLSALLVPLELAWGRDLLGDFSLSSSATYYSISSIAIALTLIPWCACMGATIPFAMLAIRDSIPADSERSFSYLYLANVLGAFLGALGPAVFVELYGFRGALRIGAVFNFSLAVMAFVMAARMTRSAPTKSFAHDVSVRSRSQGGNRILVLLFATGCTSMGAEVVWVREFTPYVSTVVYAFALLLALYLVSTYIGSRIYRRRGELGGEISPAMCAALGLCVVLAAMTADPQLHISRALRLMIGIVPLCSMMGFVTPMLVDRWSAGDPDRAGSAYAVNVLGCIVGPLLSGFLLLPYMAERWVLFLLALPWLGLALASWPAATQARSSRRIVPAVLVGLALFVVFTSRGFEAGFSHYEVLRDDTATVIATGEGMHRRLLVNGIGITELTPTTKMMAHLPLASLMHPPQNALAICFGMGTSYRSLMSWNIPITAVELVPSVPKLFSYFHADAQELLNSPLSHVVINDGRAYLERNNQQFDVITIDPPPPVEAAGSSLLYSTEFYSVIRQRLRSDGILQQWLPKDDSFLQASIARSLAESFPYVRVYAPMTGAGLHFLASNVPLPEATAEELAARMPSTAARDLTEWGPGTTAAEKFALVLGKQHPIEEILARDPQAPTLTDDRPVNEFYALRRYLQPGLRRAWMWLTGAHNKSTVTQQ